MSLIITRVKKPDDNDRGKLKLVLKYIKGTRELKITLRIGDMAVAKWRLYSLYLAHEDCWGHTRVMIPLGKKAVPIFSTKQKINGNSSTEGELIGVYDAMTKILW